MWPACGPHPAAGHRDNVEAAHIPGGMVLPHFGGFQAGGTQGLSRKATDPKPRAKRENLAKMATAIFPCHLLIYLCVVFRVHQ